MRRWAILVLALVAGFGLQTRLPGEYRLRGWDQANEASSWVPYKPDGGPRGELVLRCAKKWGLTLPLYDRPPDLHLTDPELAAAASRESVKFRGVDYGGAFPVDEWRLVHRSDDEAVVVFGPLEESIPMRLQKQAGEWRYAGANVCGVDVGDGGRGLARWGFRRTSTLPADSTSFTAYVYDVPCSGLSAAGRIDPPVIRYTPSMIVVTFTVAPPRRVHSESMQGCRNAEPVAYSVTLSEPVGERALADGAVYPPWQLFPPQHR